MENEFFTVSRSKKKKLICHVNYRLKVFQYGYDEIVIVSLHKNRNEWYVKIALHDYEDSYFERNIPFPQLDLAEMYINDISIDSVEYIISGGGID